MIKPGHIVFIALLFVQSMAYAQLEPVFKKGPAHNIRMLIVPFDPRIYLNDATPEMAKKYNCTHDELMLYFRAQWNRQMHMAFVDSCYTVDLLTDNTKEARDDINGLYTSISYVMETKMQNRPEVTEEPSLFRKVFPKKNKKKAEEPFWGARTENGELVSHTQSDKNKYLHIVFNDTLFLQNLATRRNVDMFLFINQFEIKGNYGDPYASGRSDFSRNFKVHFSIYNASGELLHGSYSSVDIPFGLYDRELIVNEYFPPAIRQIIHNIEFEY